MGFRLIGRFLPPAQHAALPGRPREGGTQGLRAMSTGDMPVVLPGSTLCTIYENMCTPETIFVHWVPVP